MTGVAYVCASKLAEQRITMARMDPGLHVTLEWRVDRILLPNTDFCFLRASKEWKVAFACGHPYL